MPKLDSGQSIHPREATGSDVHQILGDVDDGTAVAILALRPTVAQLEEARAWLNGTVTSSAGGIARSMASWPRSSTCSRSRKKNRQRPGVSPARNDGVPGSGPN